MDNESIGRSCQGRPGLIEKSAQLATDAATEEAMQEINKYTMEPLTADQVFTFKAVLCDNEVDRDFERFSLQSLEGLRKLFLGKTVIKDHRWSADNQVARIYSTELIQSGTTTKSGEPYTQLVAHCYMVKTASNADLIAEIRGGIKKEGSLGCGVAGCICGICGTDNTKDYCGHFPGREYATGDGTKICTFTLENPADAYEFSLVAVPAQKAAGVSKNYTGVEICADVAENESEKAAALAVMAELAVFEAKNKFKEDEK